MPLRIRPACPPPARRTWPRAAPARLPQALRTRCRNSAKARKVVKNRRPKGRRFCFGGGVIRSLIVAGALALASVVHAAEQSPLGLSFVLTPDLRLVYFDPTLTYLEPH